jgi:hypothetical protein
VNATVSTTTGRTVEQAFYVRYGIKEPFVDIHGEEMKGLVYNALIVKGK